MPDKLVTAGAKHEISVALLCCGALITTPAKFDVFKACCMRYVSLKLLRRTMAQAPTMSSMNVRALVAFGASALQAVLSSPFFVAYIHKVYIEGVNLDHSHIADMLSSALYVARHTPVFIMTRRMPSLADSPGYVDTSFRWSHPTIRPWGSNLPLQCPACGSLASLRTKQVPNGSITTTCLNPSCSEVRTYHRPAEAKVVRNGEVGHWLVEVGTS